VVSLPPATITGPVPVAGKTYRLQVAAVKDVRNAVNDFNRLKDAGLSPAYDVYLDQSGAKWYRVVLSGVRAAEVKAMAAKLGSLGFKDVLAREER